MRTPRARNASFDHARRYAVIAGQLFRGRKPFGPRRGGFSGGSDFLHSSSPSLKGLEKLETGEIPPTERAIVARGVRSELVLRAMSNVPREAFLPHQLREFAYTDCPLPVAEGQAISQPYIVALMTEALALEGEERVLEIGTGSGYAAAITPLETKALEALPDTYPFGL